MWTSPRRRASASAHDLDDVLAPGRRIARAGPISGGAAGTARMGGRTTRKDAWGDGMINEEDRGSAHDRDAAAPVDRPVGQTGADSSVTTSRAPRGSARS